MIWLIDPADGGFVPVSLEQYAALPSCVAGRYLARMTILGALETSRRIRREKEGKN